MDITKVVIGIQARSTSSRFPRKILQRLDSKYVLQHVLESCQQAARYINRSTRKTGIHVEVAILCPEDDELIDLFKKTVTIIEGPEDDVLSRYYRATMDMHADYVCRITADCVLMPSYHITKAINTAVKNEYEYVSNCDEDTRTVPDGYDVEVIKRSIISELDYVAKEPQDREHVTAYIRAGKMKGLKQANILATFDLSDMKISLDTPDDFENIKRIYFENKNKRIKAIEKYGSRNIYNL